MTLETYLMHFIGRPYIWGGNGTGPHQGFDCSGLVLEGLTALGLYSGPDTTAQGLYNYLSNTGDWVDTINTHTHKLLFFGKSTSKITHVAVGIGNYLMIEAGGGGSKCISLDTSTGFVRVRPISSRKDLVATLYH